jgi:hypothetical protein
VAIGSNGTRGLEYPSRVRLASDFQRIVDGLPRDWTYLELDLRIEDESRYVEAAVILAQCNAQGYSRHDWHWRIRCAHEFGHAASAQTVHGVLSQLDSAGVRGELAVRQVREGRVEVVPMWGRPESVRREFAQRRAQ